MTTIESALSSIGLPVFPEFFDSTKKYKDADGNLKSITEYITYTTVYELPVTYADDVDEWTQTVIDVDLFTQNRTNANSYKLRIRDALRSAGYTITETVMQYESDTRYYHTTVSVTYTENTERYGG